MSSNSHASHAKRIKTKQNLNRSKTAGGFTNPIQFVFLIFCVFDCTSSCMMYEVAQTNALPCVCCCDLWTTPTLPKKVRTQQQI